jgi:hypothetical protein
MSAKIRLNKACAANFTNRQKAVYHLTQKLKVKQTLFLAFGVCVVVYIGCISLQLQLPKNEIINRQKELTLIKVVYELKNKALHKVQWLMQAYL